MSLSHGALKDLFRNSTETFQMFKVFVLGSIFVFTEVTSAQPLPIKILPKAIRKKEK